MITLQAWQEQHPDAHVVDVRPGQVSGGKWVQADAEALRSLSQLSDFKVAHRGTSWLLKPVRGQYGGSIAVKGYGGAPVAELDLPRQESIQREVDALLEAEKYVIWFKENGNWVEQGDGEMSKKTCERIVSELRREVGGAYKILPAGVTP